MESLCNRVWAIGVLVLASLQAAPASATQFLYSVTGVTTADMYSGLYGSADPTLPAGLDFTATFIVDDALPTAIYTGDALQSSARGGGQVQDGSLPPLSATLQIGSYIHTIRQGNFYQPYAYDPVTGDAFGTEIRESDIGVLTKNVTTGRLDLYASYDHTEACCGWFFGSATSSVDSLELFLRSPAYTSADFRETGDFALTPQSIGQFLVGSITQSHSGDVSVYYDAAAGLLATHLTVSALPEPDAGLMMMGGLTLVGGAGWVRRYSWRRPRGGRAPG